MSKEEYIGQLSAYLFWDVDKNTVDLDTHSAYIIQRVLEYGQLEDWKIILSYYGLNAIVQEAKNFRTLEPRALAYLSIISNTPKEEFRCYTLRQSNHLNQL